MQRPAPAGPTSSSWSRRSAQHGPPQKSCGAPCALRGSGRTRSTFTAHVRDQVVPQLRSSYSMYLRLAAEHSSGT
eukprot:365858-Chlamydomonas_euryale.AAC.3